MGFLHENLDSCTRIPLAAAVESESIRLIYRKIQLATILWFDDLIRRPPPTARTAMIA